MRRVSIPHVVALFRVYVRPIHTDILPPIAEESVRYLHLSEVPNQYSMGIFVFPPHARIPLHDHPGMCVISRVLYGSLERLSLDLVRDSEHHWYDRAAQLPPGSKRAFKQRVDHLLAPQCVVLYPFEGNLHEFVAGPSGAAVLDVLLPPYDSHRDCSFYEIQNIVQDCWIVPTGQPEDFHCISGRYQSIGSGISSEYHA